MNYCQRDKEVLWYSYFLLFLYFDTWGVNFNINIEPVKHNCFLKKCHRNNTIIRYHRCCNFRLQNILKRFDLHYIEMNWYTLCYINTHNITKLKKTHTFLDDNKNWILHFSFSGQMTCFGTSMFPNNGCIAQK